MTPEDTLLDARYELKFNAKSSGYRDLQAWLYNHPAVFSKIFESRVVNNIYFDNHDLDSFHENLTGISSRAKLRLRWYGDTINPSMTKLELKLRRSMLGWKIAEDVSLGGAALSEMSWRELGKLIKDQVPSDLFLHYSASSFPVLMNRYKRDYYLSADKKVRVTIDRDVQYFDQRSGLRLNKSYKNISPDILIMEVKVDEKNTDEMAMALQDGNLKHLDDSQLFDRALEAVIGSLRQHQAG